MPNDFSANAQKPENVVNGRTHRQMDGRTDERVARGYSYVPLNLVQDKMWSEMNI